jgi:hypothetical protein
MKAEAFHQSPVKWTQIGDGIPFGYSHTSRPREQFPDEPAGWPTLYTRRGFIDRIELSCELFMQHAGALFAAHPITKVVLSDRRPAPALPRANTFWRCANRDGDVGEVVRFSPILLPWDLYWALPGSPGGYVAEYPSFDSAMEALSSACTLYGCAKAGLNGPSGTPLAHSVFGIPPHLVGDPDNYPYSVNFIEFPFAPRTLRASPLPRPELP